MSINLAGRYIAIEGLDGVGKTTLCERLRTEFSGLRCVFERDPGGTKLAELLRPILKSGEWERDDVTELLLFTAARRPLMHKIQVYKAGGECVISDRCLFSTIAYQAFGMAERSERHIKADVITRMSREYLPVLGTGRNAKDHGPYPDLVLWLDAPVETRYQPTDEIERRGLDFRQAVRDGYVWCSHTFSDITCRIDATQEPEKVFADAMTILRARFGE